MTGDLSASGSVTEQATAASKSGPSESMKKQPPATSKVCKCHLMWIHLGIASFPGHSPFFNVARRKEGGPGK